MRILLVSDSHGDFESLNNLLILHPDCDYYFHLGDSCLPKYYMQSFLCIKGNCDFENFDTVREITINNIKFHLEHGDKIFTKINNYIKDIDCDVFLFGHTHCKLNTKINNKIVINAYTQYNYSSHKPQLDYFALGTVLEQIKQDFPNYKIIMPKIGAGLAGGNWDIISSIIEQIFPNSIIDVYSLS